MSRHVSKLLKQETAYRYRQYNIMFSYGHSVIFLSLEFCGILDGGGKDKNT